MDKIFLIVAICLELLGIPDAQNRVDFFAQKMLGGKVYAVEITPTPTISSFDLPKIPSPSLSTLRVGDQPPQKNAGATDFEFWGAAGILVDSDSAQILASKEADKALAIASITKLMTASVALEKLSLDKEITVSYNAVATQITGSSMGLFTGEKMSARNLLQGMLINSANDAAYALAEAVSGSEAEFVKLMNEKASKLRLTKTKFVDSTGLTAGDVSTVKELSYLARYVLRNENIASAVQIADAVVTSTDGSSEHYLKTTNWLLRDQEIHFLGLKTGSTDAAGECLVALVEQNGIELISVVLASPDRFAETKELVRWGFSNFSW